MAPEIQPLKDLGSKIHSLRGLQVMLDEDLAELYGVEVKALNRSMRRNIQRFPLEFAFQLTSGDMEILRYQFGTLRLESGWGRHRKYLPYAFTEQGVAMLSAVLRSETAVRVSIQIMQAFVEMRRQIQANAGLFQRFDGLEKRQIAFETNTEKQFGEVFAALGTLEIPRQGVFFEGQVHDAHVLVSDLVRSAQVSIVLIDNFVDDTVLTLLAKRSKGVSALIFTRTLTKTMELDLTKHNSQYAPIDIREFTEAHDRFLILDTSTVYHLGASLKDLGKKWFAFSRIEKEAVKIIDRLPP